MSPTEQGAYFALLRKERKVVTTEDFALLYGIPAHRARNLLSALAGRGVVYRLGRGRYAVLPPDILYDRKSYTADPYTVTDAVMEGERYFVSYVSAAHLHGIVTQAPITVLVSTLKQRRPVELETGRIRFVTISRDRFFGTEQTSYFGSPIIASDLERTVFDCLDRPDLAGGMDEAARIAAEALERLDFDRLIDYAARMKRRSLVQRLGFVLEKLSTAGYNLPKRTLDLLDDTVERKFPYLLDPKAGKGGKLSPRWRVHENVDCLRWLHA